MLLVAAAFAWSSRIDGLLALPLHNDEGLHITRALAVWEGHPFWEIRDGKIVNHWAIAFFAPQHAPDFAARIATVFTMLPGLAAAIALARRLAGTSAGWLAAALWVASPYLLFYERLAFSDAQAGALVVVAAWACVCWWARPNTARAALVGLSIGTAALFKFTALPYALAILVLVAAGPLQAGPLRAGPGVHRSRLRAASAHTRIRIRALLAVAAVGAALFAAPVAYLLVRGGDLFSIALGWVGAGDGPAAAGGFAFLYNLAANLARMTALLTTTGDPFWLFLWLAGFAVLVAFGGRARVLAWAWAIPTLALLALGREAQPRHFAVVLPLMLVCGGVGLGLLVDGFWFPRRKRPVGVKPALSPRVRVSDGGLITILTGALLLVLFQPFAETLAHDPAAAPLPALIRGEHVREHSAGYGLREAVRDLSSQVPPDTLVWAAFFPDSCARANFYAQDRALICGTNSPAAFAQVLEQNAAAVYVLTDTLPIVSPDVRAVAAALGRRAVRVAQYPRPGESPAEASVVLWRIERAGG
jgi:hypothetical protein